MTVNVSVPASVDGVGNGSATVFSFSPMKIFETTDMTVTLVDTTDGSTTLLTEGTGASNYSISAASGSYPSTEGVTGSVTYPADEVTPMTSDEKIVMKPVFPLEQENDLQNQGGYLPENQEASFDKLVLIAKQLDETVGRGVTLPLGSGIDGEIVNPGASEVIAINSAKDGLETVPLEISTTNATPSDATPQGVSLSAGASGTGADFSRDDHVHLLPTVTVAKGGTGATDAATARTNLGAIALGDTNTWTGSNEFDAEVIFAKGADVASNSALSLGSDGNYFDITGTTTITSINTVGIGAVVRLHFDGVLTLTHSDPDLVLPTGANITTAAGDEATFVEYATGDWRCTSYQKASGSALVGGGMSLIATVTASADTSADFDAQLDSTYSRYLLIGTDIVPGTDSVDMWLRTDSDAGVSYDAGATDYAWAVQGWSASTLGSNDTSDASINLTGTGGSTASNVGNAADEASMLTLWINNPSGAVRDSLFSWTLSGLNPAGQPFIVNGSGTRNATAAIDSISILMSSGTITGTFKLYGIED